LPLLDGLESQIYLLLTQEEYTIDMLVEKLWNLPADVMGKLALLELKWLVKKNMSGKYTLT
jgi:hypothetical protein